MISQAPGQARQIEHRFTIAGQVLIVQYETDPEDATAAKPSTIHYLISDGQGSLLAITDQSGQLQQRYRYTPFGEQQDVSIDLGLSHSLSQPLHLGYSGHHTLHEFGLVHMQGRIYDPAIGRMLQADPLVQSPAQVLSYNRYSYVWNNPMSLTDPSGYISEGADELTGDDRRIPEVDIFNPENNATDFSIEVDIFSGQDDNNIGQPAQIYSEDAVSENNWDAGGNGDEVGSGSPGSGLGDEQKEEERTWGSYLPGTEAGDNAAQYWADIAVNSDHLLAPLAHIPGVFAALWTDQTAASTSFTLGTAGLGSLVRGAAGPLKQWIRFGPSHSKVLGEGVSYSVRWGASPVGGGKYIQQIPSSMLQRFNQWLRKQKLPGTSWRTQDAGHLHIKK